MGGCYQRWAPTLYIAIQIWKQTITADVQEWIDVNSPTHCTYLNADPSITGETAQTDAAN